MISITKLNRQYHSFDSFKLLPVRNNTLLLCPDIWRRVFHPDKMPRKRYIPIYTLLVKLIYSN